MADPLLEVSHLVKRFPLTRGVVFQREVGAVKAVDDVTFSIATGETLGLVGETGCGKTTAAKLTVRLIDPTSGSIRFDGEDVTAASGSELKQLRREMQVVFQDPFSSLNPRRTVGSIIADPLAIHGVAKDRGERRRRVQELMEQVGLSPEHYNRYPHAVLWRAAPADRDRPRAGAQPAPRRARRARLGARRLDPGPGDQPALRAAGASSGSPTCSWPTTSASCATSPTGSR